MEGESTKRPIGINRRTEDEQTKADLCVGVQPL